MKKTFTLLLSVFPFLTAWPQTTNSVAETAAEPFATRLDVAQLVENGGILVYLLGVLSVVALALILYFFISLTSRRISPAQFMRDVLVMLKHGRFQ